MYFTVRSQTSSSRWLNSTRLLVAVFFLSGVSALIYQVAWQRLLFGAFGVDVESVTIVISTFMLGLGCGALAGGRLADRFPERLVLLFALSEVGIGLFGLASPWAVPAAGAWFMQASLPVIALVNFVLILFPTLLMGSTLPILVAHSFKNSNNVGVSIGSLYFFNTMGAALGAFLSGAVLFTFITLNQSIQAAAFGNFLVAAIAILLSNSERTA